LLDDEKLFFAMDGRCAALEASVPHAASMSTEESILVFIPFIHDGAFRTVVFSFGRINAYAPRNSFPIASQ
jgi:hypothetical protein